MHEQASLDFGGEGDPHQSCPDGSPDSPKAKIEIRHIPPCNIDLLHSLEAVLLAMRRGDIQFSYEDCYCYHLPSSISFFPSKE